MFLAFFNKATRALNLGSPFDKIHESEKGMHKHVNLAVHMLEFTCFVFIKIVLHEQMQDMDQR